MVELWDGRHRFSELTFGLGLSFALHILIAGLVLAFPHLWGGKLIKVPVIYEVSLIGPLPGSAQATSTEVPLVPPKASSPVKASPAPKGEHLAAPRAPSAPPRIGEELTLPKRAAVGKVRAEAPAQGGNRPLRGHSGMVEPKPGGSGEGHGDLLLKPPPRAELPSLPPLPKAAPPRAKSLPPSVPKEALLPKVKGRPEAAIPPIPTLPTAKGPSRAGLTSGGSEALAPAEGAGLGFRGEGVEVEGDPQLSYYLALVKYKIESIWGDLPTIGLGPAGPVIVSLRILRSGEVRDMAVEVSSGNRLFYEAALRAIRLAQPLTPLP
ncbi:MAG: TonB family protein [Candidatus Methylomirabilales bacterium]